MAVDWEKYINVLGAYPVGIDSGATTLVEINPDPQERFKMVLGGQRGRDFSDT